MRFFTVIAAVVATMGAVAVSAKLEQKASPHSIKPSRKSSYCSSYSHTSSSSDKDCCVKKQLVPCQSSDFEGFKSYDYYISDKPVSKSDAKNICKDCHMEVACVPICSSYEFAYVLNKCEPHRAFITRIKEHCKPELLRLNAHNLWTRVNGDCPAHVICQKKKCPKPCHKPKPPCPKSCSSRSKTHRTRSQCKSSKSSCTDTHRSSSCSDSSSHKKSKPCHKYTSSSSSSSSCYKKKPCHKPSKECHKCKVDIGKKPKSSRAHPV